ncbi:unnamed protein product [Parajaminaea phylloscopi]
MSRKQSAKAAGKRVQADAEPVIPMGKYLASTEKRTRDSAVRSLSAYLSKSGAEPMEPLQLAKLWQGIFYCFWMSDKPLVQQDLASELSQMLLAIPGTSKVQAPVLAGFSDSVGDLTERTRGGLALLEGFWDAMSREWGGLDKWRVDKFYMLLRRFVNAALRLLAREQCDRNSVAHFSRLLVKPGGPLCANDVKVPDSLTYHLTDVYLPELEKALASPEAEDVSSPEDSTPALLRLLQPFVDTASTCHSSTVYDKIFKNIFAPILDDCLAADAENTRNQRSAKRRKVSEDDDAEEGATEYPRILASTGLAPLALRARIYKMLFEAASREDAVAARRRKLYTLYQEEKQRREAAGEDSDDDDDDE